MWLILRNVIAFFTVRVPYAYVIFPHKVRTVRVRYSRRERTVAPCTIRSVFDLSKNSGVPSVRPPVRLSVTLKYRRHIS